jgi:hypothetical protein
MPNPSKSILASLNATGRQAFILQEYYCSALSKLGKCTLVCDGCQDSLGLIFNQANSFVNPRNPEAILGWCIRERLAQIQEQEENEKPVPVNWLGERVDENPFEMFLKKLK